MKSENVLSVAVLVLLAAAQHPASSEAAERSWWSSHESLSDYEAVRSISMEFLADCLAAASTNSTVHLVAFNATSGLCTHFRCRLGLSHCRKCRNGSQGAPKVWTASNDCWTTVQHRVSDSVNFYRNWSHYQSEFGDGPGGNYWIGLNNLHVLTSSGARKLRILMKAWNDSQSWAEYSSFSVGPESDNYRLSVSGFSGSAGIGDSLTRNNGSEFTTGDADHDTYVKNCAVQFTGAWWFSDCFDTHPNGQFKEFALPCGESDSNNGIIWKFPYGRCFPLNEIEMLII